MSNLTFLVNIHSASDIPDVMLHSCVIQQTSKNHITAISASSSFLYFSSVLSNISLKCSTSPFNHRWYGRVVICSHCMHFAKVCKFLSHKLRSINRYYIVWGCITARKVHSEIPLLVWELAYYISIFQAMLCIYLQLLDNTPDLIVRQNLCVILTR